MIIEAIIVHHIKMPLRFPFETSFGRTTHRECIIIEIHAQEMVGYGECVSDRDPGYSSETSGTSWIILQDFLIPVLKEVNIQQPSDIRNIFKFCRGHLMAKAGVEMAIWDLFGKQMNRSLREMLGGNHERVKVGVSVGIQSSTKQLVDTVANYINDGYERIKIKIKPGRDISETRAIRKAFPRILLQVDANSAYTLSNAQALIPLDELNLLLIEQPLDEDDLWDHHKLQSQFLTPICLDESILSTRHARQAIEMQACRVINIKAGRVGGISEAIGIHNLCRDKGIPVWCGGMLETGIGRASNLALASLPGFSLPGDISATDRYYAEDITKENFLLNEDSTITVPSTPGLGVTVDPAILKKYTIRKVEWRFR
jgi:O-succinylbenzoate synthase